MWPFRRKVEAPAADGPHPVPAPVIRRDWAGLPPIQRLVGAHPLTAPSDQFSDDLATHQDPSVSTDTMGHQVSAEAPPGLVLALARPTTRSDGPAMIPRPRVQRSVAGAVAESGEWDGDEAAPDLARPTPVPMSAHPVAARELPVVAPEPPIQRLTSLPPDAEPTPVAPVAQRSRAVPTPSTMSSPSDDPFEMPAAPTPRLTLGQSRRMGLGAPIKQVPDHSVQRAAMELPLATLPQRATEPIDASTGKRESTDTSTVTSVPMDSVVQRVPMDLPPAGKAPMELSSNARETQTSALGLPTTPSLDASDEPRLDLPLAHRPAEASAGDRQQSTPTAQLSATSSPEPASDSPPPTPAAVQRLAPDGLPTSWSSESPQSLTPADAPRASSRHVWTSRVPLAAESPARVSTFSAVSAPDFAATAPLVGARPLRPSATVQRFESSDAPTLILPQRGREDADGGRELSLMRAADDTPYPDPSPQASRENQLAFLKRESEETPTLTLPRGRGREDAQETREVPSMRGREQQPLPLAPSRSFSVQRATQAVDESEAESMDPADGDEPTVQGAWYDSISAGVSSLTSGAGSSLAGPVGSAIGSVASSLGGHKTDETDMDELAGKLYDRIRSRLKTELLVDRERAGFLTDLR